MIQQLPRLLTYNAHNMVMSVHRHVPSLLPRLLQSCIFHMTRISLQASSQNTLLKHGSVSLSTIREFSGSSCMYSPNKKSQGEKSTVESSSKMCQVFDQNEMLIGHMTVQEAQTLAKRDNLRLADLGKNSDNLQSFRLISGRELAAENKRMRTEKKNEKVKEKEFHVTSKITDHDLDIKIRQARDVLMHGDQATFVIKAHKRSLEDENNSLISQLMKKVTTQLQDCAVIKHGVRTVKVQKLHFKPLPASKAMDDTQ